LNGVIETGFETVSLKPDVSNNRSANNHAYVKSKYCNSLQILQYVLLQGWLSMSTFTQEHLTCCLYRLRTAKRVWTLCLFTSVLY